ncbi:tumor necrosis factor receptor superfamily member 11B-like isoform 2-T2 [Salvelinus alpinus]
MNTQYIQMTVICLLCFWTSGLAADLRCNDMYEKDGRCCGLCPPGTFLKKHCTTHAKTDCGDCPADSYSEFSDRVENCQPCLKCQQDHVCSKCEKEKKCRKGEELKRTGSREYTWKCVPCPNNTYSDTEQGHCKPLTQCGTHGFVVIFPGNKTQNSKCGIHGQGNKEDGRYILATGFFFFAVILLVFLAYACIRRIGHKPEANIHGLPLSKEESEGQLIQQAETKDNASQILLSMASISTV